MISDVPCEPPDSMAWTWRGGTLAPAWKAVRKAEITAGNSNTLRVFSVSITGMQSSCRIAIIAWAGPCGQATPAGGRPKQNASRATGICLTGSARIRGADRDRRKWWDASAWLDRSEERRVGRGTGEW